MAARCCHLRGATLTLAREKDYWPVAIMLMLISPRNSYQSWIVVINAFKPAGLPRDVKEGCSEFEFGVAAFEMIQEEFQPDQRWSFVSAMRPGFCALIASATQHAESSRRVRDCGARGLARTATATAQKLYFLFIKIYV